MISGPIDLRGRTALVTGGARGIGAAAALALAREGATVAGADVVPATDTVRQVEAFGRRALAIVADVSSAADVRRMADEAVTTLGHIDILVNGAGVVQRESLLDTTEAVWDRVVAIDLKGKARVGLIPLDPFPAPGPLKLIAAKDKGALRRRPGGRDP